MRIESFDRVLLILALSLLAASACNGDDDDDEKGQEVDSQIVDNLIVENQIVGNQNARHLPHLRNLNTRPPGGHSD